MLQRKARETLRLSLGLPMLWRRSWSLCATFSRTFACPNLRGVLIPLRWVQALASSETVAIP